MLSLTPMSSDRAKRLLEAFTHKPVRKLSGKGLSALLASSPELLERLYVVNRSMFGSEHGLGPDDEGSLASLRARGVTRVMIRANSDRDVITVVLQ